MPTTYYQQFNWNDVNDFKCNSCHVDLFNFWLNFYLCCVWKCVVICADKSCFSTHYSSRNNFGQIYVDKYIRDVVAFPWHVYSKFMDNWNKFFFWHDDAFGHCPEVFISFLKPIILNQRSMTSPRKKLWRHHW